MVPLLVFHNALTWLSVFLNSLAAFWLILSVTGMAGLAFIGALAFAHSPVLTSYHGAQSLLEPYMLVFFMLASLALFKSPGYRRAIGSGILLGLSVYTYPYYFVAGLVWLGVVLGYRLFPWTDGETGDAGPTRRFEPGMIGAWLLFALVLVLVLVPRDAWPFAVGRTLGLAVVTLALVGLAATAWSGARRRREGPRVQWRPPSGREAAVTLSVARRSFWPPPLWCALPFTHAYASEGTVRSALDSRSVDFLLLQRRSDRVSGALSSLAHRSLSIYRCGLDHQPSAGGHSSVSGLVLDQPPGPGIRAVSQKARAACVARGLDRLPVPVPGTVLEASRQSCIRRSSCRDTSSPICLCWPARGLYLDLSCPSRS